MFAEFLTSLKPVLLVIHKQLFLKNKHCLTWSYKPITYV